MNPVKGTDLVVLEIAKALGIDPARCKHFSLDFPPGGVVTASFTLYPTREQIEAVKDLIVPVAEGIQKNDQTELALRVEMKEKALFARMTESHAGQWTNDEIRRQIIGDTVEEFAGAADPAKGMVDEKSYAKTYADAFVHSFMSAEELHARTQKAVWGQPLAVKAKRVDTANFSSPVEEQKMVYSDCGTKFGYLPEPMKKAIDAQVVADAVVRVEEMAASAPKEKQPGPASGKLSWLNEMNPTGSSRDPMGKAREEAVEKLDGKEKWRWDQYAERARGDGDPRWIPNPMATDVIEKMGQPHIEQIPAPPEPADEPKKVNFREFF